MLYNTNESINSPVRQVLARVELYRDSSLVHTWTHEDRIKKITIERVGDETKFFGYGICQKANVHLIDKDKEITDYTTQDKLDIRFTTSDQEHGAYGFQDVLPSFQITRCNRDEITNELSITAYDALYYASNHTFSELELTAPYTVQNVANAIALLLTGKMGISTMTGTSSAWSLAYAEGANYSGSETLREVLDDIAEITQSIYYISQGDTLTFNTLTNDNQTTLTIQKDNYISLTNKANRRLGAITHTTELGDNISASGEQTGTTQYIRDNPFWNLRDDIDVLVQEAWDLVGGLTINQFDMVWRGNFYLCLGERFSMVGKDNEVFYSFLLNDVWEYDGGFRQKTQWVYSNTDSETASSPATLGDILKDTYAKVDKVNKEIELVAKDLETIPQEISELKLTTESIEATVRALDEEIDSVSGDIISINNEVSSIRLEADNISASVESITTATEEAIESMNNSLATITNKVQTSMTAEQVNIAITSALNNGVNSVTTTTGFTFNDEGLKITKNDSEIHTTITEDGMTVYKNNEAVLVANNEGVQAQDLHATTFLIIGTNSRFEDYDNNTRTGCFWIGGNK